MSDWDRIWGSSGPSSSMVPVEVVEALATVVAGGGGGGGLGWRVRCVNLEGQKKSSADCGSLFLSRLVKRVARFKGVGGSVMVGGNLLAGWLEE
jgi:hypothetical protein